MKKDIKTIHLIWLKGKMPEYIEQCFRQMVKVFKSEKIKLWLDKNAFDANGQLVLEFIDSKTVEIMKLEDHKSIINHELVMTTLDFKKLSPAIQSDVYRLAILEEYGGLYLDLDIYMIDNICDLIRALEYEYGGDNFGIVTQEDERGYHNNDLLYAEKPHHPFIGLCISTALKYPQILRRILKELGPTLIGSLQHSYRKQATDLLSLSWVRIHPYSWREAATIYGDELHHTIPIPVHIKPEGGYSTRVYGMHLWNDLIQPDSTFKFEKAPYMRLEVADEL